jgi:hypothetical protein
MPKMHGPYDQIGWQGQTFKVGSDGSMDVPAEAVDELLSLGMHRGVPATKDLPQEEHHEAPVALPVKGKNKRG